MAIYELEIWDSGKTTRTGFVKEVIDFRISERVNAAPRWSVVIPAEDRDSNVVNSDEVYLYSFIRGSRHCLLGGEVLEVEREEVGNGGVNLTLSGLGLLNELNYEYIDSLDVQGTAADVLPYRVEQVITSPASSTDLPNTYDDDTGTSDTFDISDLDYLYIYAPAPFWDIDITLATAYLGTQTLSNTQSFEYYSTTDDDWKAISVTDGTANAGRPYYQNGTISYTLPTDWGQINHSGYQGFWGRLKLNSASPNILNIDLAEVQISTYGESSTDLADIFTTAGYDGGLTLQTGTGYYTSTTDGYYGSFQNTTALAAYRQLADSDDGIFRTRDHDERIFCYFRDQGWDTSFYAVGPASNSVGSSFGSANMIITGIRQLKDTQNEINRLYVYGSGNGRDARIDLSLVDATQFATDHSGYTVSTANNYIENTSKAATKVKGAGKIFPEIRTVTGTENSREASEQLVRLGFVHLDNADDTIEHLELELVQIPQPLRPGDNITVIYRRQAIPGGFNMYEVNGEYTITQASHRTVNGVLVANCTASTINRPPKTTNEILYETVEMLNRQAGHPQRMKAQHLSGLPAPEA